MVPPCRRMHGVLTSSCIVLLNSLLAGLNSRRALRDQIRLLGGTSSAGCGQLSSYASMGGNRIVDPNHIAVSRLYMETTQRSDHEETCRNSRRLREMCISTQPQGIDRGGMTRCCNTVIWMGPFDDGNIYVIILRSDPDNRLNGMLQSCIIRRPLIY